MDNLKNEKRLVFNSDDTAIVETISSGTRIHPDTVIRQWDLTKLEKMFVGDSLESSKRRNETEHRTQLGTNIAAGAALGGLLDASNGDDSIVDGIILGGAAGAFMTSDEDEEEAKIGLIFSDGEILNLNVDMDEFTIIGSRLTSNKIKGVNTGASMTKRQLRREDIELIHDKRRTSKGMSNFLIFIMALAGLTLAPTILLPENLHPGIISTVGGVSATILGLYLLSRNDGDIFNEGDDMDFYESIMEQSENKVARPTRTCRVKLGKTVNSN